MRAIKQKLFGHLYHYHDQNILLLGQEGQAPPLYMRYALVQMGTDAPIFPGLLLDDWGNEIKKLEIYSWIRKHGTAFPRAELFGFDVLGRETQLFLRELELYARYPCFAFLTAKTPLVEGLPVGRIMLPTAGVSAPRAINRPDDIDGPLRRAQISWWEVDPAALADLGYQLLSGA